MEWKIVITNNYNDIKVINYLISYDVYVTIWTFDQAVYTCILGNLQQHVGKLKYYRNVSNTLKVPK